MMRVVRRIDPATLIALAATVVLLLVFYFAVAVLYFLITIKAVQHSNSGILSQVQTIVNNHTGTINKLADICRALPHCMNRP